MNALKLNIAKVNELSEQDHDDDCAALPDTSTSVWKVIVSGWRGTKRIDFKLHAYSSTHKTLNKFQPFLKNNAKNK